MQGENKLRSRSSVKVRRARHRRLALLAAIAVPAAMVMNPAISKAANEIWDPALNGSGSGGTGNWDLTTTDWYNGTTDVVWPNTGADVAIFGGTGGTVSLKVTNIQANGLTFNVGGYTIDNGGTAANILTLAGTTPTITVTNAADTDTISAILAGGTLNKAGAGTLVLSGTNTNTGTVTLSGGTLSYGVDANLGTATNGITFTGGTLSYTGAAYTFTRALTVTTGNFGTIQTPGTGATSTTGKLSVTSALLTGGGTFTKLGAGDMQFTVAQAGFTGTFIVGGGIEVSVANAFGSGTAQLQIQKGGELSVSANQINSITITTNGTGANPIISPIGNSNTVLSGAIAVNGPLSVALRGFNNTTTGGFNLTFSGPLSGSGAISLSGATTNPGQTLFLTGNNTAYTAALSVPAGLNVSFGGVNSIPTAGVTINSSTTALGGIGVSYVPASQSGLPTIVNSTGSNGGVFEINNPDFSTPLDLGTLYGSSTSPTGGTNGLWFLGSGSTGTYSASTLGTSNGTYRLGGGLGTITLSGTNVLTGNTAVIAGSTLSNGTGTVLLSAANDYTGTTTISGGTTLQIGNAGALGSVTTGTTANVGGSLGLLGGITVNEPLTISGTSSTASAINLANSLVNVSGTNTFAGNITIASLSAGNARASTTAGTLTIAGNIAYAGGASTNGFVFSAGAITQASSSVISGNMAVYTTSTSTVIINGANTYTGATNLQNGTGTFTVQSLNSVAGGSASSSLGAPTTIALGTIQFGTTTNPGSLTYAGTGETTDRVINLNGTTAGGTITQSGTGLLKFTNGVTATVAGAKTLTLQGSTAGTGEIAGVIVDSSTPSTSIVKAGSGAWTLSGLSTFTGTTSINQGTLVINTLNSVGGTASSLGKPTTVANGTIGLGSGTTTALAGVLSYIGTGSTSDRVINLASTTGAGTIDMSGTGTLQLGAVTSTGAGIKTLTLQGSTSGVGVISGVIANNTTAFTTAVTKAGSGTWTLGGVNTYTGATTVNNGLLRVTGSINSGSAVAVNGGGYLGGTGTVGGAVTTAANGGIDLRDLAVGTLTLSSTLALNGTAGAPNSLTFDFGASTVDTIAATGAVTASTANGALISFNQLAGTPLADGTYTLITSAATSVPTGFALATTQSNGRTYSLTTGTTGNVLRVNVGTANVSGVTAAVWGGTFSNLWTDASNWYTDATSGTQAGVPGLGSNVSFYTTTPAAGNLSTTLGSDFEINSLTFLSSNTAAVTIASATNALTIDGGTANSNPAGNGINQQSTQTETISSRLGIGGPQTWTVAAGGGLTISGVVFDTGAGFTLTKAGAGTLTLSGTGNTFTGDINLTAGVLAFAGGNGGNGDPLSLGAGTKTITITNNAVLRPTTTSNPTANNAKRFVVGAGGATFDPQAGVTFQLDDATQFSGTGDLTVTSSSAIPSGVVFLNNQPFNFTGNVFVNTGTLRLGTNSVLGTTTGRTITVASGAVLDVVSTTANIPLNITVGGTGISNGGALIASSAAGTLATSAITLTSNTSIGGANTLTLGGNISGAFNVTKIGAGTTVLSGTNTYGSGTGAATTVSAGALQAAKTVSLPNYLTAGQVTVASGAALYLNVGGSGEFAASDVTTLLSNGTFVSGSGIGFDTTNSGGTFTAPAIAPNPAVAALNLTKLGAGTLALPGTNAFGTGSTTILNGTVSVTSSVNNSLGTGALILGTNAGVPGSLNLGATSQTVSSFLARSNSATANTLAIGAGQTLTVTGAVTVGVDTGATPTTNLTVTGATGTLSIGTATTATNANVQLGANVTTLFSNATTTDLSGLGAFFANLGTGTFRVGDATNSGGTATLDSSLILSPTSTISATSITSDSPDAGRTETIKLGSGVNTLNANTIEIGGSTNGRANGILNFNTTTGSLVVRNLAGTGRANFNISYGATTTGSAPVSTVILTGHSADLLLGNLQVGGRTGTSGGSSTGTLSFDTGTLDVTGIFLARRASIDAAGGTVVGTSTGTVNIGGGAVTVGASGIVIAQNTSTIVSNPAVGVFNITGGTVTVGATSGNSITLGSSANATNGPSTATLNLLGGVLSVTGNIITGSTTGVTSALTLNGGTLNMANHSIGSAAAPVTVAFQSGTLDSLAELNGGAALNKTTTGVLTLTGAENYTGATNVNAGTLVLNATLSATAMLTVDAGATLKGQGTVSKLTAPVTVNGTLSPGNSPGVMTIAGSLALNASSTYVAEIGGTTPGNSASNYDQVNTGSMTLTGGNLIVSSFNDFATGGVDPSPYFILTQSAPGTTGAGQFNGLGQDAMVTFSDGVSTAFISYTADSRTNSLTGGNDVALYNVNVVPEPAVLSLTGLATIGMLSRRRRRAR